jgi:hypothetical protein
LFPFLPAISRWLHWASFTFSFAYLAFCRSFYYLGLPEIPDYLNAVVMLLTLRVVGLAFDRHRFELEKRKLGAEFKPPHPLPGFVDICHYSFCYIGVLTGKTKSIPFLYHFKERVPPLPKTLVQSSLRVKLWCALR